MNEEKKPIVLKGYITGASVGELLSETDNTLSMINSTNYKNEDVAVYITLDLSRIGLITEYADRVSVNAMVSMLKHCNLEIYIPYAIGYSTIWIMDAFKDATIILPFEYYRTFSFLRGYFTLDRVSNGLGMREFMNKSTNEIKLLYTEKFLECTKMSRDTLEHILDTNDKGTLEEYRGYVNNFANSIVEFNNRNANKTKLYKYRNITFSEPTHSYELRYRGIFGTLFEMYAEWKLDTELPLYIYYNTGGGDSAFLQSEVEMLDRIAEIFPKVTIICGYVASLGSLIISEIVKRANPKVEVLNSTVGCHLLHKPLRDTSRSLLMHSTFDKHELDITDDSLGRMYDIYKPLLNEDMIKMLVDGSDIIFSNEELKDIIDLEIL